MDGKEETAQNHTYPLPAAPSEVAKPESSAPQEPAPAQQLEEVEEKISAFERSTLRWAKAAVLISCLAAGFVCLQWYEMHASGGDTHNLAVAAGNQAIWTKNLATQMQSQAEAAKSFAASAASINQGISGAVQELNQQAQIAHHALTDQRAWIGFSGNVAIQHFEAGKPVEVVVSVINSGRTPAIDVSAKVDELYWNPKISHSEFNALIRQRLDAMESQPRSTISPGGELPFHATSRKSLPTRTQDAIRGNAMGYAILGELKYLDVFKRRQWMTFCIQLFYESNSETPEWKYCESGNDMSYQVENSPN